MNPYPLLLSLSGGFWAVKNKAINGQLMSSSLANAAVNIDPLFNPLATKNVIIIWSGIDDLASSVTPATVYANLQSYCTARHAVGWKVIVVTLPSNKFVDNTRDQFNTLLRNNHSFADGFVDFGSTPFGPDGTWANTNIYQSDGVHLLQATIRDYEVTTFANVVNAQ